MPPSPSTRIFGPYQLLRELGGGPMSVVYQAWEIDLPRPVALKLLRPERAHDPQQCQRFLNEARRVATLSHPNIVKVLRIGNVRGVPFIAFVYIGESMADRLRRDAGLSLDGCLAWLRPVAAAVDHAHGRGIYHRDIKPANILIDEVESVYLSDFGLDSEGGTPAYMAPELFNGSAQSVASDIYALGVTAYELMAGEPPFTGNTIRLAFQHSNDAVPQNERVPRCAHKAISRAMAKNPRERWPSATAFVDALEKCRPGAQAPWLRAAVIGGLALFALLLVVAARSCRGLPPPDTATQTTPAAAVATDTPADEVPQDGATSEDAGAIVVTDTPVPAPGPNRINAPKMPSPPPVQLPEATPSLPEPPLADAEHKSTRSAAPPTEAAPTAALLEPEVTAPPPTAPPTAPPPPELPLLDAPAPTTLLPKDAS